MADEYFDERLINRQRLLWTIAARRQLERWELILANAVRDGLTGRPPNDMDVWSAEIERHFALIAARNLFRALDLPPVTTVSIDPTLRAELIEGRDLHEHWRENLPVFNVRPRVAEPRHPTGRAFAARNPDRGPYSWLGWTDKTGARLLPHVSASALHELVDAVEADVVAADDALSRFVPPRRPSPWLQENGEWWPS